VDDYKLATSATLYAELPNGYKGQLQNGVKLRGGRTIIGLMAVTMEVTVAWDLRPYSLVHSYSYKYISTPRMETVRSSGT
jgi:hypothetical protein